MVIYGIASDKVGLLGFSAGAHLAVWCELWRSDDPAENPDFVAYLYGGMGEKHSSHAYLSECVYLRDLTEDELAQMQILDLVTEDTSPAFIVHAYDDDVRDVKNATIFAEKLHEYNVPLEMHLFPSGGHGFGSGHKEHGTDQWLPLFVNWLHRLIA